MKMDIYKFAERYKLTDSEEIALDFILNNLEKSLQIGVRGVSKECYCSSSVIMNLAKKLGYSGFVEMIYKLEQDFFTCDNTNITKRKSFFYGDEQLEELFIQKLKQKKPTPIFIYGVGFSSVVAKYFADKLIVEGFTAILSEYRETMNTDKFPSSLLILISKSGETSQLIDLCRLANQGNIEVISFVGKKNSTIDGLSSLSLIVKHLNLYDDRNLEENDFFGNTILAFERLISKYNASLKK